MNAILNELKSKIDKYEKVIEIYKEANKEEDIELEQKADTALMILGSEIEAEAGKLEFALEMFADKLHTN